MTPDRNSRTGRSHRRRPESRQSFVEVIGAVIVLVVYHAVREVDRGSEGLLPGVSEKDEEGRAGPLSLEWGHKFFSPVALFYLPCNVLKFSPGILRIA